MPEISYVDLDGGVVCLIDGQTAPITNLLDVWGDDCEPENAVVIVAGPFAGGWLSIDLEFYTPRTLH